MAPTRLVNFSELGPQLNESGSTTVELANLKLEKLSHHVPYAILSHRWLDEGELHMEDFRFDNSSSQQPNVRRQEAVTHKSRSARKLIGACRAAHAFGGIKHIWIDSLCIDQKNPVELSEAINSMFRWYQEAAACIVYLPDVYKKGEETDFSKSVWFRRGWTLQELVASRSALFYDANWQFLGSKEKLGPQLQQVTRIDQSILQDPRLVQGQSISHRMSWAANRETGKEEDMAYCLMGIFDVNMPVLYGEGAEKAFRRLQQEIIKESTDHTIFAWRDEASLSGRIGILARSPKCFATTGEFISTGTSWPFQMTNVGLSIGLPLQKYPGRDGIWIANLNCRNPAKQVGIAVQRIASDMPLYARVDVQNFPVVTGGVGQRQPIYIKQAFHV